MMILHGVYKKIRVKQVRFYSIQDTPQIDIMLSREHPSVRSHYYQRDASITLSLSSKSASTNKMLWKECVAHGPKVNCVAKARWVRDGNIWTSSGVSAGIDATLAWVVDDFGEEMAIELANIMEFTRAESPWHDPFSVVFKCEDVPAEV
jgi:hypothetical protein